MFGKTDKFLKILALTFQIVNLDCHVCMAKFEVPMPGPLDLV
jgi:hypothetical protein